MRAAAILGLGCSPKSLKPFQNDSSVEWRIGLPATGHDADIILIFGGDGTIHRHLAQLVELKRPVLVVPAGSGNDFARALGLRSAKDSLTAWFRFCRGAGDIHEIDLGVISAGKAGGATVPHNSTYFCCVAGVGLDGEVSRRANRLPRWLRGNGGYVLSLAPAVFSFAPLPVKISIGASNDTRADEWTVRSDRPTLLAAFANTTTYGDGMKIAPQAKMCDGLLDVCVVGALSRRKLFTLFPTV